MPLPGIWWPTDEAVPPRTVRLAKSPAGKASHSACVRTIPCPLRNALFSLIKHEQKPMSVIIDS